MIDFDNELYTYGHNAVKAEYPNVYVTSNSDNIPSKFPAVSIATISNVVYNKTRDTCSNENHVAITIQVDVYSNKKDIPKSECKAILAVIDNSYLDIGFSRNFCEFIPNADNNKTRLTARYRAVLDKNGTIYRR